MRFLALAALPALSFLYLSTAVAAPAQQHLTLTPNNTQARLQASSAVSSIDGTFEKVSGSLSYNLEEQSCHVDLTMNVDSLKVGSALIKGVMLSGLMLDSDAHPTMHYVGDCTPKIIHGKLHTQLVGTLTMRGQTHPLTFAVQMHFTGNTLTSIASNAEFDQRKWGLSTLLHTVDPMVKTQTLITLPAPNSATAP
ncbi:YceI family protein [Acetobacter orientalis]|uniref:YceI family protein n=1 Tax=Acetobacter orientalis TaxID=146474 RepID=UPI0039E762FD